MLALMAGGLLAGCSSNGNDDPWTIDPEGYDGISETTFDLISNPCVIANGTMTLKVKTGETVYVTLRATDNMVIAGGTDGNGGECAVSPSSKINIIEDTNFPGTEKVFLDYINGPFALGTVVNQAAVPGLTMTLGLGSPPTTSSSLVVRGSSGVDKMYLGSTTVQSVLTHWINVNGDTTPDVKIVGVTDIKVSTGVGADIISADGGNGAPGAAVTPLDATVTFSAYGGPDADTLTGGLGTSTLDGGAGDDKFIQTLTIGKDIIVGGTGVDTVDYSIRPASSPVNVTTCTNWVASDPCSCDLNLTGCQNTANTNYGTCSGPWVQERTDCKGMGNGTVYPPSGGCAYLEGQCEITMDCANQGAGQAACIAACQMAQTTCNQGCDTQFTNHNAGCVTQQTADLADCSTIQKSCKLTCRIASPKSACLDDDGAANEHDSIGDDVEVVLGGKGNDTLSVYFSACSDGTTGNKCSIKGNDGNDTLVGGPFNDSLDGGAGDDILQPGLGNDTLVGGAGIDTVTYAERFNAVKVSLDSTKLWTTGQNGEAAWTGSVLESGYTAPVENDSIAADIENLIGGPANDFLRGNASANIIRGGAGNDTIEGGAGNDTLYGDLGNDKLYGGAGNDQLIGGDGTDTLVGGDGDDFIDATDSSATSDTLIDCDGVNDSTSVTAGTSPGSTDSLVKDSGVGVDGYSRCELQL